jgi:hypothetical protein
VAARAVVLGCVVQRAYLEVNHSEPGVAEDIERIAEIVERADVRDEVEPGERRILSAPLGGLSEQEVIDGTWRAEAVAVLAWALGRFELPAFDEQVDPFDVATALGMAKGDVDDLLESPSLRPAEEIDTLAEQLFAAHWRLRQFGLDGRAIDLEEFAATAWFGPLLIAGLPLVDRDLAIRGSAIADADPADVREVESIVMERRTAAGWLRGENELISEVPLDT